MISAQIQSILLLEACLYLLCTSPLKIFQSQYCSVWSGQLASILKHLSKTIVFTFYKSWEWHQWTNAGLPKMPHASWIIQSDETVSFSRPTLAENINSSNVTWLFALLWHLLRSCKLSRNYLERPEFRLMRLWNSMIWRKKKEFNVESIVGGTYHVSKESYK